MSLDAALTPQGLRPEQGHPRRWLILALTCLALIVTGLDTLIVTMALPAISSELGTTASQLQWVVDAYAVAFAAPILFAGALADRFGRRRGFVAGLGIFLLGSLAAMLAGSPEALIAARVGMGLGAALIMPASLALIRAVFPAHEQGKALGIWVGMASLGVPLGPLVGGALLQLFWWGSVFAINLPLVAVAILGSLLLVPESRSSKRTRLDVPGLLLSLAGMLALIDGIIEAPARGWASPLTLILIVGGLALLGGFLAWERRTSTPMLSPAVFTDRRFGGPLLTIGSVFFAVFGSLFLVTQLLQGTLRLGALQAGLHLLPMCSMVLVAPVAPRLVQRFGLGRVSVAGPVLAACALLMLGLVGQPSGGWILLAMAILGLGIGFGAPTSVDSILAATPADQSGAGSAMADVAMQFGGALGIAILGSLARSSTATGFLTGAGIVATAAILVFAVLGRLRPADRDSGGNPAVTQ